MPRVRSHASFDRCETRDGSTEVEDRAGLSYKKISYVIKYYGYTVRHAQWGDWSITLPLVLIYWSVAAPVRGIRQLWLTYLGVVADGRNQSVERAHRTRLVVLLKFIHGALTSAIIALLRRCLRCECFRSRRSEALPLVSLLAVP